mgnify:CR=1 FL=1
MQNIVTRTRVKDIKRTQTFKPAIDPMHMIEACLWLFFLFGVLLKCSYFQFSTKLNSKPYFSMYNKSMFLSTFSLIMILASILLLFFNRKRLTALLITDILLSLLILADTLYFRYYSNAITVPVLYQIGLVSSITDSVKDLFRVNDLIFLADFPLFLAGLHLIKKKAAKKQLVGIPPVKRLISSFIVILISLGLFHSAYAQTSPSTFSYDNNYVINDLGILYFHYYDIKRNIEERYFTDRTLKEEEKNAIDNYFNSKTPSGTKYRGVAEGKNLIIIQMEAIQQFVINRKFNGKEITPNLNKFINESCYLDNFYYQVGAGNTSDAEFLTNNSLYPLKDGAVYFKFPTNTYESLPKLLKKKGYTSYAFHAYTPSFWNRTEMYKAVGFDKFINSDDFIMDEHLGWGLGDESFLMQSLDKIDTSEPFYGFFITLSSHHPYNYFEDYEGFDVGPYEDTMTGNYVKAANYVDKAVGRFLDELKARGLYDNSIIVIYGDHHAVLKDQTDMLKDLIGFEFSEYNWTKLQKTPCFIRYPGMTETGVNNTICGEIDLLPTIANLMGIDAPYALGKDIFNTEKGYAVLRNSSVITEEFTYVASEDKVYGNDGQLLDKSLYESEIARYQHELEISDIILNKNALSVYLKD